MLSKKTRYALQALMILTQSRKKNQDPVLISELARRGKMPRKFLESILLELKNNGILQSKKGKGGGYTLAKAPQDIPLGQVIRLLEGPLALLPCVSQMAYRRCEECPDPNACGIRQLFQEVRDSTSRILDGTSLAKVQEVQEKVAKGKNQMYFI